MRVTHVITRLIVGGAQENTIATVLGLHQIPDVRVNLLSGPTTGAEGSLVSLFDNYPKLLREVPTLVRPVDAWKDLLACRTLMKEFLRDRPDIVHTHSGKAGILGRLIARRAKVPLVIHSIHGPSFGSFQGGLANYFFKQAESIAARFTHHFISVAQAMTDQYLAAKIGHAHQYTRIFSGFRLEPFLNIGAPQSYRNRWGLKPTDFVIGKVARLSDLKGHNDLLEAAARLLPSIPTLKILLIGDGPLQAQLRNRVEQLRLVNHVIFSGLVRPEEIPECLGAMDAVVHLSRREGLPRALSQALAASRPIVAYDCDGAREVCQQDQTGHLLPPGDINGVVRALCQLHHNPERRREMGDFGRSFVSKEFSESHMVARIHELYRSLLNRYRADNQK